MSASPLRLRVLGRVAYGDALALQHGLAAGRGNHLLLLEHPHVYTLGVHADPGHLLASAAGSGAEIAHSDRGGDVTYHGPGQLVGYPVLDLPMAPGAIPGHVHRMEQLVIEVLAALGLEGAGRLEGYPGVWLRTSTDRPAKICAIGVRVERGRTLHGFALNVDPDLSMFGHIVPCGLADKAVTSLAAEGIDAEMGAVIDAVAKRALTLLAPGTAVTEIERQDAVGPSLPPAAPGPVVEPVPGHRPIELRPLGRRLAASGVDLADSIELRQRKPAYMKAPLTVTVESSRLRSMVRELGLVTVCEEAGCPNLSECWSEQTATFMINGERCTRACGFCLVDTRRPGPLDPGEPDRVAEAVVRLGLAHAVVTAVARDDLSDGGAGAFASVIAAIRHRSPTTAVEVLIPDCKGQQAALDTIFAARPEVLNHNLETVLRLQRAVRPSASYARSLSVLARAKRAGLVTKSGLILGLGETEDEVLGALSDLAAIGVDIVTIGQYLRPTAAHLPVMRWWRPEEFDSLAEQARAMGFAHVEASPLTRSSYHARQAAGSTGPLAAAGPARAS